MSEPFKCPFCSREYDAKPAVCVECGMDMHTLRRHRPQVSVEEDEEPEVGPSRARIAAAWVAEYLPGFFRPTVLIASIVLGLVGLGVAVFAVALVFVGVLLGSIGAATLGGLLYGQALAWLLVGRFDTLVDALVEFDSIQWMIWFILLMLPGTVFIAVAASHAH